MCESNNLNILKGPKMIEPIWDKSFGILMHKALKSHSNTNKTALVNVENGNKLSYNKLFHRSVHIALELKELQNYFNIKFKNVAICSENHEDFFIPVVASLFDGFPIVHISHTYNELELLHALNTTKPYVIFCSLATREKIKLVCNQSELDYIKKIYTLEEINYNESKSSIDFEPTQVNAKSTALMIFSSGTTGMPKAVMVSHYNLSYYHNLFNDKTCVISLLQNYLIIVPFTHVFGLITSITSLIIGKYIKFMTKFNEDIFLGAIEHYKIKSLTMVPPLMAWLSRTEKLEKYDLSSLETIFCGAAPLTKSIQESVTQRLKHVNVYQAYGMSELTLIISCSPKNCKTVGAVGQLFPGISLKIRAIDDDKKFLGPHEIGEILASGPMVANGYLGNPADAIHTFLSDGWLATGDLGYYDQEGYLYIVDRLKELIKYNGFQVHPAELEGLLMTHVDIADAAVVGLRNEEHGELPVAFVVKKEGSTLGEEEIQKFIKNLVSYPKYLRGGVYFMENIPRTSTGKILRRELRKNIKDNI